MASKRIPKTPTAKSNHLEEKLIEIVISPMKLADIYSKLPEYSKGSVRNALSLLREEGRIANPQYGYWDKIQVTA